MAGAAPRAKFLHGIRAGVIVRGIGLLERADTALSDLRLGLAHADQPARPRPMLERQRAEVPVHRDLVIVTAAPAGDPVHRLLEHHDVLARVADVQVPVRVRVELERVVDPERARVPVVVLRDMLVAAPSRVVHPFAAAERVPARDELHARPALDAAVAFDPAHQVGDLAIMRLRPVRRVFREPDHLDLDGVRPVRFHAAAEVLERFRAPVDRHVLPQVPGRRVQREVRRRARVRGEAEAFGGMQDAACWDVEHRRLRRRTGRAWRQGAKLP